MTTKQVYEAIHNIQTELAKQGIAKESTNSQQGYKFRGIDQVYSSLSPLLAKHGLVILPSVKDRSVVEATSRQGGVLYYTSLVVDYHFVSVADGSEHVVTVIGEAMDSGDKSTNKAMSAAYKYAVLQSFCIPTEGDNDADATTHEVVKAHPATFTSFTEAEAWAKKMTARGVSKPKLAEWMNQLGKEGKGPAEIRAAIEARLDKEEAVR